MSEESRGDDLQFESVTPPPFPSAEPAPPGVTCTSCGRGITVDYFDLNNQPICRVCRVSLVQQMETPLGLGMLLRAGAFGLAAALAGAALYYAVIAITDYEIGLVAIAIGYMVGYAVRAGAKGRGARRIQVLAVVLTYVSVSVAYLALALGSAGAESSARADAVSNQASTAGASPLLSLAFLAVFSLALPVLSVVNSMPSGLISAAIIAFGMQQAWRMTMAAEIQLAGPFRVGPGDETSPA